MTSERRRTSGRRSVSVTRPEIRLRSQAMKIKNEVKDNAFSQAISPWKVCLVFPRASHFLVHFLFHFTNAKCYGACKTRRISFLSLNSNLIYTDLAPGKIGLQNKH